MDIALKLTETSLFLIKQIICMRSKYYYTFKIYFKIQKKKKIDSRKEWNIWRNPSQIAQISLVSFYILLGMSKDLKFPSDLKLADVVPAFKKEDSTLVETYVNEERLQERF